jgi:biotin carboxyl carrier protein
MTRRRVRLLLALPSGPEDVVVSSSAEGWVVEAPGGSSRLDLVELPDGRLSLVFEDGRQVCGRVSAHDGGALVSTRRGIQRVAIDDPIRHRLAAADSDGDASGEEIRAMMPGRVLEVAVSEGSVVASGAVLLVLEAMKMQNEIRTSRGGRVVRVEVQPGQPVEGGALMVILEPVSASS